jgi:integrase
MAIEQQGERWTVRYRQNGARKRYSLPAGSSRRDAERMERKIRQSLDEEGTWEQQGRAATSLNDLVDQFKAHQRDVLEVSEATLRGYRVLDRFVAFAAGRANVAGLEMLCRREVSRFLLEHVKPGLLRKAAEKQQRAEREGIEVRQTNPANTLNGYAKVIKAWWTWARDHDEHGRVVGPVRMPKLPSSVLVQVRAPAWEHIDAMLAALEAGPVRGRSRAPTALLRSLWIQRYTGLRVGQASRLAWEDFARDVVEDGVRYGALINVNPALGKSREEKEGNRWIPVPPALMELLDAWNSADGAPATGLIVGPDMPRDPHDTASRAWQAADVPPERWQGHPTHAIRKRVRSYLEASDLRERAILYQIGHAPGGTAAKHYIDPVAYLRSLRPVIDAIPTPEQIAARVARAAR